VLRQIKGGTIYRGHPRPKMSFPSTSMGFPLPAINNLVVIQSERRQSATIKPLSNSGLPVYLEEE